MLFFLRSGTKQICILEWPMLWPMPKSRKRQKSFSSGYNGVVGILYKQLQHLDKKL